MQSPQMPIKDEFYALIKSSFTSEQISAIKTICEEMESNTRTNNDFASMYYELAGWFYTSAKNYEHFFEGMKERIKFTNHTAHIVAEEDKEGEIWQDLRSRIIKSLELTETFGEQRLEDCFVDALTNALFPEVISKDSAVREIKRLNDYKNITDLKSEFDDNKVSEIIIKTDKYSSKLESTEVLSCFKEDFVTPRSLKAASLGDIKKKILVCDEQRKTVYRRIVQKTAMILVKYGVLSDTTSANHNLLNETREHVKLKSNILFDIFMFLLRLNIAPHTVVVCRETITIDTENHEYRGATVQSLGISNSKPFVDKVQNMFKPNIPFISDFSYDDIDERYMGCLFPVLKKN